MNRASRFKHRGRAAAVALECSTLPKQQCLQNKLAGGGDKFREGFDRKLGDECGRRDAISSIFELPVFCSGPGLGTEIWARLSGRSGGKNSEKGGQRRRRRIREEEVTMEITPTSEMEVMV